MGKLIRLLPGYFGDLWAYDPSAANWTDLSSSDAPTVRAFHGFAAVAGRLYAFGGKNGTAFLGDLWAWDPAAEAGERWANLSERAGGDAPPGPRAYLGFAAHGDLLFVFGGWCIAGEPPLPLYRLYTSLVTQAFFETAHSQSPALGHAQHACVWPVSVCLQSTHLATPVHFAGLAAIKAGSRTEASTGLY